MQNNNNTNKTTLRFRTLSLALLAIAIVSLAENSAIAQEPKPGPARTIQVPEVRESKLKNGMTVAVVEKRNVPIVTMQLLVRSGAENEASAKAGLADMTASLITKGTATRSAAEIAEQVEFLGGSINSGAGWNNAFVTISVTSDKIDKAMEILADVVLNPAFPKSEIELLRSQAVDGLSYNLTQPGFLANYVASVYSYREHPSGGTPQSLTAITRDDIAGFYNAHFRPQNAVLLFAGDISADAAAKKAQELFGKWTAKSNGPGEKKDAYVAADGSRPASSRAVRRILVVDLPNSGQAAVSYAKPLLAGRSSANGKAATSSEYFPASVLNSLLGGGYSSRLNQEIRIKRGLSYGAGSTFLWRASGSNFGTRTQTKNESAGEVAELVVKEVVRLTEGEIPATELDPRKSVLTGGFGRNIETTGGLVGAMSELYTFGLPTSELNRYMTGVNAVSDAQIRDFAKKFLLGGDIVIVGDYAKFKEDIAKRFPNVEVSVVAASELDITEADLKK